jgi:hypothetical protein
MQHFADCDGSAIFRISSKQIAIRTHSYQTRMDFDLFSTCPKFSTKNISATKTNAKVPEKLTNPLKILTCLLQRTRYVYVAVSILYPS